MGLAIAELKDNFCNKTILHLFFQFVFQSRIEELGARDWAAPLVLLGPKGGAEGGVIIELDAGGGFVQGLDSSNLVDHDKQVIDVIVMSNVFIRG